MNLLRVFVLAGLGAGLLAATGLNFAAAREDQKDAAKVEEGKPAPNVELEATQVEKILPGEKDVKKVRLADLKGKKNVVLFFFPKAMTKGCTIESCGFRDKAEDFAKLDTVIIGISTDKVDDQLKFTEKEKLNFPLFADPDKKAAKAYGVLNPERGLANRLTFVIDKEGVVRKIYTGVNPAKHPQEVLDYVEKNLKK